MRHIKHIYPEKAESLLNIIRKTIELNKELYYQSATVAAATLIKCLKEGVEISEQDKDLLKSLTAKDLEFFFTLPFKHKDLHQTTLDAHIIADSLVAPLA